MRPVDVSKWTSNRGYVTWPPISFGSLSSAGALWSSFFALAVSVLSYQAEAPARKLTQDQIQGIIDLQRSTPKGRISAIRPHGRPDAVSNMRRDPSILQQVYTVNVTADHIPDNGQLFIMVHNYGQGSGPYARFFPTQVKLIFRKAPVGRYWRAGTVYMGLPASPKRTQTYRVSLYLCNSRDAARITHANATRHAQNYGLQFLRYPSCQELDSIFVRRVSQ